MPPSEQDASAKKPAVISTATAVSTPTETSPLLPKPTSEVAAQDASSESSFSKTAAVFAVLSTSFLMSLSFGVTQVPLLYTFQAFCCDDYYESHPDPRRDDPARCQLPIIEAETARQFAIMAAGTTIFGVVNIFYTGFTMKRFGLKPALLMSIFFPAARLFIQNIGTEFGGRTGIIILQSSQIITVVGGPAGYMLALNSFAAELVKAAERTAILGRVSGAAMFGTATGFLMGGYLGDLLGLKAPFRATFVMFATTLVYAALTLPRIEASSSQASPAAKVERRSVSWSAFLAPLKMYTPSTWRLKDGRTTTEYGVLLMGVGTFMCVLATGYQAVLLQLFATDALHFSAINNGWLTSTTAVVRGIFLSFLFPGIIARGRKWYDRRRNVHVDADMIPTEEEEASLVVPDVPPLDSMGVAQPVIHTDCEPADPSNVDQASSQATSPPDTTKEEEPSYHFDLLFTTQSSLLDGILTGLATFVAEPWQLYLLAVILPFASGTGPAAKGTVLQMVSPSQRADALSAITLVEAVARLATIGAFGAVFSAFAAIGRPELTFTCNAAVALVAWTVLSFARFPPDGARREAEIAAEEAQSQADASNEGREQQVVSRE